jgi:hypothetical protein
MRSWNQPRRRGVLYGQRSDRERLLGGATIEAIKKETKKHCRIKSKPGWTRRRRPSKNWTASSRTVGTEENLTSGRELTSLITRGWNLAGAVFEATIKQHPNSELRRRVLLIETRVSGRKANRQINLAVTSTVHEHHNKTWQDFRSRENKEENQKGINKIQIKVFPWNLTRLYWIYGDHHHPFLIWLLE